jgi:hypothetical protein
VAVEVFLHVFEELVVEDQVVVESFPVLAEELVHGVVHFLAVAAL